MDDIHLRLYPEECPKAVENFTMMALVTEPPQKGVRRQDQLERFSTKREHNQHT
jgi:cyclophilin family peptidyl-prolyl cis-trans isomerase